MSSGNSIKDTFFEECDELLEAISDGLAVMEAGRDDNETLNSVFRGVHSIKGGAGAFGMEQIVSLSHSFETVLDRLRSDQIPKDKALVSLLHRASDQLASLIEQARTGDESHQPDTDTLLKGLNLHLAKKDTDSESALSFEPTPLIDLPVDATWDTSPATGFRISFTPSRALYANGHEPLLLFQALTDLGELSCKTDPSAVPPIDAMAWDTPYLSWELTLQTTEPEHTVQEVFEFVDGLCELAITPFGQPADLPAPPVTDASEPAKANAPRATLRVDLERVDRLINTVGELIINQAMIAQKIAEADLPSGSEVLAELEDYQTLARDIQEGVMAIRAQPVKPLFQRMSRIIREATDATGKSVKLITEGETTEVDKTVIERLADPLTHMIRNAVDHGIESPEDRQAAGKDPTGSINLSASHRSGNVLIKISDDGGGLDRDHILQTAIRKGLVSATAELSESEIDHLMFLPGFSTASSVSNLSGRGVGLDIVKTSINNLGGRVSITSEEGKGSTFSITLPLTLAVLDGMVVQVTDQVMIVPLSSILETMRPAQGDLHRFGVSGWMLRIRETHVPIFDVASLLGLRQTAPDYAEQVLLLVESEDRGQFALAVDDISDQRQVVIKGMQTNYGSIPGISAATIMGDGKIALIVDPDTLTNCEPVENYPDTEPSDMQEVRHAANA